MLLVSELVLPALNLCRYVLIVLLRERGIQLLDEKTLGREEKSRTKVRSSLSEEKAP